MDHIQLGNHGEALARSFLQKKGYLIISSNYKWRKGEIDLICSKNNELVIVEVKTRQTGVYGEPYLAVSRRKQQQIIQVTNQFIQEKNIDLDVRFDVISIIHNSKRTTIEHIEGAFIPLA